MPANRGPAAVFEIASQSAGPTDTSFRSGMNGSVSNGGIFSHYLGARLSARVAAIAPVAGGIAEPLRESFKPEHPVSVLMINGTEDPLVPFYGGGVAGGNHGRVIQTEAAARLWAGADGCVRSGKEKLPAGAVTLRYEFTYDGGGLGKGGTAKLFVNDKLAAEGKIPATVPLGFTADETLDVGEDTGTPAADYKCPFRFEGRIERVTFELN